MSHHIGVVGIPGAWSTMVLLDEIDRKAGRATLIDPVDLQFCSARQTVLSGSLDLLTLNGLVVKKIGHAYSPDMLNRLELLSFVKHRGVPVISNPDSIKAGFSRLSCTMILQKGGIPMPPLRICEGTDAALEAVEEFGRAVFKPLFSTKARGMTLLYAGQPDLREQIEGFMAAGNPTLYIQQLIPIPGRDMGVVFLGGSYLATYARVKSENSWNTTTLNGGRYTRHEPGQDILDLAERAQALFDLDYTCVDIAETDEGPVVFEVSVFGGFRGLIEGCGVNAPSLLADHVVRKVKS